jgi:hypothetical protein
MFHPLTPLPPLLPTLLTLTLLLATTARAHNIQMGAHSRECFHEMLHKDDKMTVTFQVGDREFGGAGNLEVDFWVSGWVRFLFWGEEEGGEGGWDGEGDGGGERGPPGVMDI